MFIYCRDVCIFIVEEMYVYLLYRRCMYIYFRGDVCLFIVEEMDVYSLKWEVRYISPYVDSQSFPRYFSTFQCSLKVIKAINVSE